MDKLQHAGKNKIAEAVSKMFLARVFDRNQGFAQLQVRDIVTQIFRKDGQVENQDLFGNFLKLSEPWDANMTFQELVQLV